MNKVTARRRQTERSKKDMASLMQIARETADYFRDGIAWIIVWKTGRSWHAEPIYLDPITDKFGFKEDEKLARDIVEADANAKMLNGEIHGVFGEDSTVKDVAEGIRWLYEENSDLLSDVLLDISDLGTKSEANEADSGNVKNTSDGTLTSEEEKMIERIDAMPIEELVEIVKKTLKESHIPYTVEEGGKILFPGIFTDKSRSPPDNR